MLSLLAIVISYLAGSISFSIVIAKLVKGIDIRNHGSGNAGATNTLRVLGIGPAILVLALDLLKGMGSVALARIVSEQDWLPVVCGLAAIIGHNWPIWFKFKGGKGIATAIGVLSVLVFIPALIAGIIAILSIVFTRYVSLGSLIFTFLTPIFVLFLQFNWANLIGTVIICIFAFIRHRSNIVKLWNGTENKLGSKKGA
ncbi:glycerol-3-phosphate acyltransferase 2 [Paenibacillus montaniterrae]|uniref:Glycerol-3-phosphate acyltransferase n=1 Tax=Paenibacillus montaniterrae TaxID=429341 RepID=A0A919YPT4_9BACL|nr:glycerol-3-phosphate 1-O-acyltransferase PlsY [Paenibacillus montaniterrae]GIP15161.1 glycerol-3-phosphate acyltransferase 2 [Paenibacillus montaniterrae]